MNKNHFLKVRIYITLVVSAGIWGLLAWDYFHGGVPKHHLLAREDLPGISNWWGGLILPLLTWLAGYRIQERENLKHVSFSDFPLKIIYGFAGAVFFGIILSILFTLKYNDLSACLLQAVLVISLFCPVYKAESLLGFVLTMTFTFGAVLPTVIGSVLAIIGFVMYKGIRPAILYVVKPLFR